MGDGVKILFEDAQILVCYKPAGVPVQSARPGVRSMESLLKTMIREREEEAGQGREENGVPYLGVVHRLDQPVFGVLVFARTSEAAAALQKQMAEGRMEKRYLARVTPLPEAPALKLGSLRGQEICLTDWVLKDGKTNTSRVVRPGTKGAKKAILHYRALPETLEEQPAKSITLLIRLVTGRHHQIRVQLANALMPIVGDRKYGLQEGQDKPLLLCARSLRFFHPATGEEMTFCVPDEQLAGAFGTLDL